MIRKALMVIILLAAALLPNITGCTSGPEFPNGITGTVFEDANANGIRDNDEQGVKGVLVSNGAYCRPTNSTGEYNLPAEGSLLYITTPRDYTPTGRWYTSMPGGQINFGLRYTPEKDSSDFTFVQMTDIHLAQEEADEVGELVAELNEISPAFVVATGDLVDEGNGASVAQAEKWFHLYDNVTSALSMPLFNAVGNHDVVGIHRQDVLSTSPGYGEALFVDRFGPTYYSFDWGDYHCIVLDPNDMVDGKQVYQISDSQLQWLKDDLRYRKGAPVLAFFHEPTACWRNRAQVLAAMRGHKTSLFCGHLHQDIMTDATDISEQVTGAVSGEWWYGNNPDGRPAGYRIVSVKGDEVDSLYKGTGKERTIDPCLTPIVNGEIELAVKIHSEHGAISEASYQVDDAAPVAMTVENGPPWATASTSWDTTSLAEGYHRIAVEATDRSGSFSKEFEVKVSDAQTVSVSDLTSHLTTYQGSYVSLEGTVAFGLIGPSVFGIPEGMGFLFISDGQDRAVVIAGECFSPLLTEEKYDVNPNDRVIVKAVPLRLSTDFVTSTKEYDEYYSKVQDYVGYLPSSAKEEDAQGRWVALWGLRWLSADDLTILAN